MNIIPILNDPNKIEFLKTLAKILYVNKQKKCLQKKSEK